MIFEDLKDVLFYGASIKDPRYKVFEKLTQLIVVNYHFYLVLIAIIFTFPMGVWVYRNSRDPFLSFLLYSVLFYAFFSITGHRQTIATALVVFFGYRFVKSRKIIPFMIVILIATAIHKSALVFLPFYFLSQKKITKKYLVISSLIFLTLMIFRHHMIPFLDKVSGYGYDIYDGKRPLNFTILLIFVALITFWRIVPILMNNPQAKHYVNALLIALLFTPLVWLEHINKT